MVINLIMTNNKQTKTGQTRAMYNNNKKTAEIHGHDRPGKIQKQISSTRSIQTHYCYYQQQTSQLELRRMCSAIPFFETRRL